MSKLSDTQLVLLSAASQREHRIITPPERLKGGALKKVYDKLINLGFAEAVVVGRTQPAWRTDEDETRIGLKITETGLAAIGVEPEDHQPGEAGLDTSAAA